MTMDIIVAALVVIVALVFVGIPRCPLIRSQGSLGSLGLRCSTRTLPSGKVPSPSAEREVYTFSV